MQVISEHRFKEIINHFESSPGIMVLGDVGVDKYTFGAVERISPEAPVPVLRVTEETYKLGLAANVANNLCGLKVKNTLCGIIGDDRNGNLFEDLLDDHAIKSWGIVRDQNYMTICKERVLTNSQQICRVDYENKNEINSEAIKILVERVKDFEKDSNAIIIEDYGKGLLSIDFTQELLKLFNDKNKLTVIDPSRHNDPMIYRGCNLLKPNFDESKILAKGLGYNGTNLDSIINTLVEKLDLQKIIVTLGKDGMALFDKSEGGKFKIIPTVASEVFDVSGAGDTAISAITAALSVGATLEEAAWIGNCASGFVVGKKGTAKVTSSDLFDFYNNVLVKLPQ